MELPNSFALRKRLYYFVTVFNEKHEVNLMKRTIVLFTSAVAILAMPLMAVAHVDDFTFDGKRVPNLPAEKVYDASDAALRIGEEGITVNDLAAWAKEGREAKLEELFSDYSVSLKCVPQGHSAGTVARVLNIQLGGIASSLLDIIASASWIGKRFDAPEANDCRVTSGVNRLFGREFVSFVTRLLDRSRIVGSRSNIVELNYAQPGRGVIPGMVKAVGIYDLMVAVPGKHGPLYVGKTWFGKYNKGTEINSFSPHTAQTLWYFLDFNTGALEEQRTGR